MLHFNEGNLDKTGLIYQLLSATKAKGLEFYFEKENKLYSKLAAQKSIRFNEADCLALLEQRLKNKITSKKKKGGLRIFSTYPEHTYEKNAYVGGLKEFGQVIHYSWYPKYDHSSNDWYPAVRKKMNDELFGLIKFHESQSHIDIFFSHLTGLSISRETLKKINDLGIITINIGMNENGFRGKKLSSEDYYSQASIVDLIDFNWVVGNKMHLIKYLVQGGIPFYIPEGADPNIYRPLGLKKDIDVSFVGRNSGWRPLLIGQLQKNGINVSTFGRGWQSGEIAVERINEIFNRSKIVLGIGGLRHSRKITDLKARDFEAPMSGALYLTSYNPELEEFYKINEEIVCFRTYDEAVAKVKMLLENPNLSDKIAQAGYQRAKQTYTLDKIFEKVFNLIGILK